MVVLAAKRAANKGKRVIVVSSTDESDDLLCGYLKLNNIDYFRGSLDNTLERFIIALSEYKDDTIIHRLTADNVFPDGSLINELEDEFIAKNYEYLVCNGIKSGLPYGLSVETFRLTTLREVYKNTNLAYDLEHVTPYIVKNKVTHYFDKYLHLDLGNYRCTIDTYLDYLFINKIFKNISDPENIAWKDLVGYLKVEAHKKMNSNAGDKLVLGGVQFGLDYGINNITGKPNNNEVETIIKTAINSGIQVIDTARNYGNSENLLGKFLTHDYRNRVRISTKLSSLIDCPDNADQDTVRAFVRESVLTSCLTLKVECIDYLLLHRVEQLYKWENAVMDTLLELKNEGFIDKIGASVQSVDELNLMLDNKNILIIQMPFNIIDRRWDSVINKIKKIKNERGLIVHTRSVFLQGLLLTKDKQKWSSANIPNPNDIIDWLGKITLEFENASLIETCLAFVRSQNWIDGILVGVDTKKQLQENLKFFSQPLMEEHFIQSIINSTPKLTEASLDPSNWSK